MRLTLLAILLIPIHFLLSQSVNHVFPNQFTTVIDLIIDEQTGNVLISHVDNSLGDHRPFLSAISPAGDIIWQSELTVDDFAFPVDPDRTLLLNLNDQYALFTGVSYLSCDLLFEKSRVLLIDKSNGEVIDYSIVESSFAINSEQRVSGAATSPQGDYAGVSFGNVLHLYFYANGALEQTQFSSTGRIIDVDFSSDDAIGYLRNFNNNFQIINRTLSIPSTTVTNVPDEIEPTSLFYLNHKTYLRGSAGLFLFNEDAEEFLNVLSVIDCAQIQLESDRFLIFEPCNDRYYHYYPANDSLGEFTEITDDANTVITSVYLTDDAYHLLGQTSFDGDSPHDFGYWLRGTDSVPEVTTDYSAALSFVDAPLFYDTILADPPGSDFSYARVTYQLALTNTGSLPINSISIKRNRIDIPTICGPLADYVDHYEFPSLATGESYVFPVDSVSILASFSSSTGQFEFNLTVCASRPNENLDISYSDNCFDAILSSTNKVAKKNIQLKAFPNPTTDAWQITDLPKEALDWALLSNDGRVVRRGKLARNHSGQLRVGTENLPAGLYRLNVRTATPSGLSRGRASLLASINLIH